MSYKIMVLMVLMVYVTMGYLYLSATYILAKDITRILPGYVKKKKRKGFFENLNDYFPQHFSLFYSERS